MAYYKEKYGTDIGECIPFLTSTFFTKSNIISPAMTLITMTV